MNNRSGRAFHQKIVLSQQPTFDQMRLALDWRDCWRAEKLQGPRENAKPLQQAKDERTPRAGFARGIARAEFGRAYWDERLQRAFQQKPQRKEKIKDRPSHK